MDRVTDRQGKTAGQGKQRCGRCSPHCGQTTDDGERIGSCILGNIGADAEGAAESQVCTVISRCGSGGSPPRSSSRRGAHQGVLVRRGVHARQVTGSGDWGPENRLSLVFVSPRVERCLRQIRASGGMADSGAAVHCCDAGSALLFSHFIKKSATKAI